MTHTPVDPWRAKPLCAGLSALVRTLPVPDPA